MKPYTVNEIEQIRKLSSLDEPEDQLNNIVQTEKELNFDPSDLFASLRGLEEEPIESRLEEAYICRALTGRSLLKLHGHTQPDKIFW